MNSRQYYRFDKLYSLSSQELHQYCFIDGSKDDWEKDFNDEILDNEKIYADGLLSLEGVPLNYILSRIGNNILPWIPSDKKLNAKILYTLNTILITKKDKVRDAALTQQATKHIKESCAALTTIINKAFSPSPNQNIDDQ
ncbi:MAG: hypothetical protein E7351_03850 [Clostridiales bacterium]|nr:hypothetical protein [Clostridiales bacterium]